MATPGKLRDVLANALGLSAQKQLEAVNVHLRNLREAGLITKAKRGRGAAEIGVEDAANLLIAVAGSPHVKDSVSTVKRYGSLLQDPLSLTVRGQKNLQENFSEYPPGLSPAGCFREVVQRTLELLVQDRFFPEPTDRLLHARKDREYISMRFYWPHPAASLHFGFDRQYHVHQLFGSLPVRDPRTAWDLREIRNAGLLVVRVVDNSSLMEVAALFRESSE